MKKILALLLALLMVAALVACGGGGNGGGDDALVINAPDDLATPGLRIGVQMGTTGHDFANDNFPDAVVMPYDTNSDVILALLGGDVDAVIMDSEPARNFVDRNEGRIRQLDELLTQEYYGISLHLDSDYTALFNEAIDTLRENGTLYQLIDYWVNEDPGASRYVSPEGTTHPNGTLLMEQVLTSRRLSSGKAAKSSA